MLFKCKGYTVARLYKDDIQKILKIENGKERRIALSFYAYFHFYNKNIQLRHMHEVFKCKINTCANGITTRMKKALAFLVDNELISIDVTINRWFTIRTTFNVEILRTANHSSYCDISKEKIDRITTFSKYSLEGEDIFATCAFYIFIRSLISENYKQGFNYIRLMPKTDKRAKAIGINKEDGRNFAQILNATHYFIKDIMWKLKDMKLVDFTYYSAPKNYDNPECNNAPLATPYFFFLNKEGKKNADLYVAKIYKEKGRAAFIDNINRTVFKFNTGEPNKNNFWDISNDLVWKKDGELTYRMIKRKAEHDFNDVQCYEFIYQLDRDVRLCKRNTPYIKKGEPICDYHFYDEIHDTSRDFTSSALRSRKGIRKVYTQSYIRDGKWMKEKKEKYIHPFVGIDPKIECLIKFYKKRLSDTSLSDVRGVEAAKEAFYKGAWFDHNDLLDKFNEYLHKRRYANYGYKCPDIEEVGTAYTRLKEDLDYNYLHTPLYLRAHRKVNSLLAKAFNSISNKTNLFDTFLTVDKNVIYEDKNGKRCNGYKVIESKKEKCFVRLWNYLQQELSYSKINLCESLGLNAYYMTGKNENNMKKVMLQSNYHDGKRTIITEKTMDKRGFSLLDRVKKLEKDFMYFMIPYTNTLNTPIRIN